MTDVVFSSSYDDKHPPQNILINNKEFWSSTGLFPQEILLQLDRPTSVSSVNISSYGIKKISIESCENDSAMNYIKQAEIYDVPFKDGKIQSFFMTFSGQKKVAKLVRVIIEEGYENFCSIFNITLN
jgi:hypothetical protein